ncbi:MAG: daunorubicin resistance protein DrrA family ABC transporter ATP-binding protein [Simkaniaceae bacterium]
MESNLAVELSNLWKSFPTNKGLKEVLRGVDLEVPKGEIFGFLGPNGAGKTTTLKILTTLLPLDKGKASVAGISVKESPQEVRRRIGYVSQRGGADPQATGWENLLLQGRLHKMSKKDAKIQASSLVEAFALSDCIHRFVSSYSGGQQRRLDIALGMMHRPQILFLDEPTNGLDPQSRDNLWSKILKLKELGITVFLTSHYLDEIDALADTLAIMDHGRIVAYGTPGDLKKQISGDIVTLGLHKDLYSRAISLLKEEKALIREIIPGKQDLRLYVDKGESALPGILRLLDQAKIPLETIQMSVPSLNDVFLKKTGRFLREGEES